MYKKITLLICTTTTLGAAQKELIKEKFIRFPEFRDPFSWPVSHFNETAHTPKAIAKATLTKDVLVKTHETIPAAKVVTQNRQAVPIKEKVTVLKPDTILPPPPAWTVVGVAHAAAGPLALLSNSEGTKLARLNDTVGEGWYIEKITTSGVVCKHATGATQELIV